MIIKDKIYEVGIRILLSLEKVRAFCWRMRGCNHDGPFFIDCGDEDHVWMYCFRCRTHVT